jgi:hypothetical protein
LAETAIADATWVLPVPVPPTKIWFTADRSRLVADGLGLPPKFILLDLGHRKYIKNLNS